jgi:hypothetical protein
LIYLDVSNEQVILSTETAWTPMLKMWEKICNKYLGINRYELLYSAEEPGCGIFCTNDPTRVGTYSIQIFPAPETEKLCEIAGMDSDYDLPKSEVMSILQKYLETDEEDMNTLLAKFDDDPAADHAEIKKMKFVESTDWN